MTLNTTTQNGLPGIDTVTRITMANGLTLLLYPTPHTQSVVMIGSINAGAMYEDQSKHTGLAYMTAAALMRGTQTRDFDTLHTQLEDIGADLSVSCGMHKVGFSGKALAEDLDLLLELAADILRHPTFPGDQVERLRGEHLTGLKYLRQDAGWLAARGFRQSLYPAHHPYHYSTRGTIDILPSLTTDHLRQFHAEHYGANGMILTIVGNIDPDAATEIVRTHFGDWDGPARTETVTLPDVAPPQAIETHQIELPGKNQVELVMGTVGPSRFAKDYHAANLGNSILGVFGMMGRIGDVVREREGLAYYAGSRLEGGLGPGAWRISAGVDPDDVERATDLCREEIRRIVSEPVSSEDLADNQSYFIGRLPLQLESNEGLAATLHAIESYDLGLDYLATYRERVMSITAEDVLAATRRYLHPDKLIVTMAGTFQA